MKIFMTVLMASIAWSAADVSLLPAYNTQALHSMFTVAQQQPSIKEALRVPLEQIHSQPSTEYLPSIPQQPQNYQQQYSQPIFQQYGQQAQPQQQQQQLNSQQQYSSQLVQPLSQPQQTQKSEYAPATGYRQMIPSHLNQPQHSHKSTFSFASSLGLPMPNGLTVVAPPQFKTGRRFRSRARRPIATKKPIISKSIFIHSAPEERDDDIQEELAKISQQPRKHYNVLFVKTPVQTNRATALNFAKSLNEERTVVYVLSKKTSAADLQEALADQPHILNKPEVFFIKYRTPEEAANAQRQIQSQYESLGGSTSISDEGVAPITSVVGSLDEEEKEEDEIEEEQNIQELAQNQEQPQNPQEQHQEEQQQQVANQLQYNPSAGNNEYLPPSQF